MCDGSNLPDSVFGSWLVWCPFNIIIVALKSMSKARYMGELTILLSSQNQHEKCGLDDFEKHIQSYRGKFVFVFVCFVPYSYMFCSWMEHNITLIPEIMYITEQKKATEKRR